MQSKRSKNIRKVLDIYRRTFKFPSEIKILIDPTSLKIAQDLGFKIIDKLDKFLGIKLSFWTTQCLLKELEYIGEPLHKCFITCQALQCCECTHLKGKQLRKTYNVNIIWNIIYCMHILITSRR